MPIPIYQVDAFASRPFTGNPAAVCLLDASDDAAWMQAVAAETNLSETAFCQAAAPAETTRYSLRWFTPLAEVDLCGHATLAAAHVLWEIGQVRKADPIQFATRSGILTCRRMKNQVDMDFPASSLTPCDATEELIEAIGAEATECRRTDHDILLQLRDEAAVRGLRPDFQALRLVPARGIIVTARSSDEAYDFVSRFFAPSVGIDEDPVTGSAHCALAPYWAQKLGKNTLGGYQCSPRGGAVNVRLEGDRVTVSGNAITVMTGSITV